MCEYWPPLENLPIFDVTVFRLAQDVVELATNSGNALITNTTSGTPYYPTFVDNSSGYRRIRTNDPSYTYDANTNTISANTSGSAGSATLVNITDNDDNVPYYPVFAASGGGNQALLYDTTTTPFSYRPSTGEIQVGSFVTVNNCAIKDLRVGSKNGATIYMIYQGALPALTTGDYNVLIGGNIGTNLAGGSNNFALGYNCFDANVNGCNNCIMGHRAALALGASGNFFTWYNTCIGDTSLTNANDVAESTCIGSNTGGSMLNGNFKCSCIGASTDCGDGLSYATAIGADVLCSTSNTVQIGRSADTIIFDGTITNTIAQPAAGDSSTKVPTTAWVQTAITAGSVTTTANIALTSDDTAGTYFIPFSKTTSATSNALYIDDTITPLTYNPFTSTLTATNFSGLASNATTASLATQVTLSNTASGATNYLVMSATNAGSSSLLTDNAGATYDSTTNIAAINISGNASTISVAVDDTATTYYPTFCSTGAGQKSLLFDTTTTPLSYVPSTSTLTCSNFSGLASQSTTIAVAVDNTATTYYPTFTSTGAGQKALLFDTTTTPLSYVPSTSTLTATNFVGTATRSNTINVGSTVPADIYNIPFCLGTGVGTELISNSILQYDTTGGLNQITANLNGNAATATTTTNVALTSDDSNTTCYIPFSKTTSPTSNTLYIDNATTPLVYNPSNNEVSATKYSLGGLAPISGANAGFFAQNLGSSASVIQNQATSGSVFLNTRTALNALTTSLSVSSTTASFNSANVTLSGTSINVGQGAGGTSNLIVGNTNAKSTIFTTGNNTLIGTSSGTNMTTVTAANNTFIGNSSGLGITSGSQNTFIGSVSGNQASGTGNSNVCVGYQAGDSMTTTANENTLIGTSSATALTTGTDNVIIGFNAAASLTTGSNNIVIGSGANVAAAAANQIAIGTSAETMYIQGGFNWRVGQITNSTNGNLSAANFVLCQLYMVAMSAGSQTITLPNPAAAAYVGARVLFKRKTNTTAFTLTQAAGFLNYGNITIAASPYLVPNTIFQVDLVSDGTNWCVVSQR